MPSDLPAQVLAGLGPGSTRAAIVAEELVGAGTGAATGGLTRLTVRVESPRECRTVSVLRKRLVPLGSGRHAAGARDPRHWAYWRREAEAYSARFVPVGPGLRAPQCFGVVGDDLYLEEVTGEAPSVERAAEVLAAWQRWDTALDRPWLAVDQLGSRVAASVLNWAEVDADSRMVQLWDQRDDLLARLRELPKVLSHGDYSVGNLINTGQDVVALDWATVGWEPVGFDLAHLALSSGADPTSAYLRAPRASECDPDLVISGFRSTVALVGASRIHWMLTRNVAPPDWYTDFVWHHRPDP